MDIATVKQSITVLLSTQNDLIKQLEAKAFNLSNSGSSGFKALVAKPQEVLVESSVDGSISYVKQGELMRDFTQGSVNLTENVFDFAIIGTGFFPLANGRYTRNGRFQLDTEGRLITSQGELVLNASGSEISIPKDAKFIRVADDGTISSEKGVVGAIGVVSFQDPQQLKSAGFGVFITDQGAIPATNFRVQQGSYEESNVEIFKELTDLIEIQRRYEHTQDLSKSEEDRAKELINLSATNA